MFCYKCGKEIDDEAVVCIHCGVSTKNMKENDNQKNIIINNSASSSTSTTANYCSKKIRKHHSTLFDIFMICITCGLWIIWMLIRPKYY